MNGKTTILSRALFALLSFAGLLFAGLWLAASIATSGESIAAPAKYGMCALITWLAFEMLWRSGTGWYRRHEILAVSIFFFLIYLASLKIMPELGQIVMPYDSLRAQKSLEAGHIAFFRPFRLTYWINYDFFLSTLGMVFEPKLIVGQIANAACRAAALFPIYKLSERAAGRRMALFTTVVTALSPVLTLYASTLVGDFIAALFYLYAVYALFASHDEAAGARLDFGRWIFVGGLAGIGCIFKSISFLLWGALLVWAVFKMLEKRSVKTSLTLALALVTIWLSHGAIQSIRSSMFNTMIEDEATRKSAEASFIDGILYEAYLGMCIQTRGGYSPSRDRAIRHAKRADKIWMVKDMLKKDLPNYPKFFVEKFCSVWGANDTVGSVYDWFKMSCQKDCYNLKDKNHCVKWLPSLLRAELIFFVAFFLLGASGLFLSWRKQTDRLDVGTISLTIVLAYAAMSMIIEAHGRYKTAIYPFIVLVLPYARIWLEKDNPIYSWCAGKLGRKSRQQEGNTEK